MTFARFSARFFVAMLLLTLSPLAIASAPQEFGSDHDDPRTAYPPVERPATTACTIEIVDHDFDSFDPARGTLDAQRACPGPWRKIVMEMDGSVKGRQYDRIGHLAIGAVTVFRTSSPEPSRDGIAWHVEKDITGYAALLRQRQPVEMHLGNVVNETYTGVFHVKLRLVFYRADAAHPAPAGADVVSALDGLQEDGTDTVGRITIPANTERLLAEVYATGSGGGCEEFWYYAAPVDGYWCQAAMGPYREVQVLLDGRVAGIAAPYPHIYTGGWSNPVLWYVIPAPRTFDIHPIQFNLTPFVGAINDGKAHELRLRVLGVPGGGRGWVLQPNIQVWQDSGSKRTRGKLLKATLGQLELTNPVAPGDDGTHVLTNHASHAFKARGTLRTSHGRVTTTVERTLDNDGQHRWGQHEDDNDFLRAEWTDRETITRKRMLFSAETVERTQKFGLDGSVTTVADASGKPRLTTALKIHDDFDVATSRGGDAASSQARDRFEGSASYTSDVPRERRHAVAQTQQTYSYRDSGGVCIQRRVASRNGRFIADETGCNVEADRTDR